MTANGKKWFRNKFRDEKSIAIIIGAQFFVWYKKK